MKLHHLFKKKLAEWGITKDNDKEFYKWLDEKRKEVNDGKEIEPPWGWKEYENVNYLPYMWNGHNLSNYYIDEIWSPFWNKLNDEQKRIYFKKYQPPEKWILPPWVIAPHSSWVDWRYSESRSIWQAYWETLTNQERIEYLEKWQPPTDEWFETWTLIWGQELNETSQLLKKQVVKLNNGEEIEPPWIVFPVSFATYGWDYGIHANWKLNVWMPFWDRLGESEQKNYIKKWKPPNEDWRRLIMDDWAEKPKKN